jgi:hypothetical protein
MICLYFISYLNGKDEGVGALEIHNGLNLMKNVQW